MAFLNHKTIQMIVCHPKQKKPKTLLLLLHLL